jgi:exonuclease SbcC
MKITEVEISNIKSYDDDINRINLTEGINAIVGQNGAGKSTIQEAIGFALFDYLGLSSQDDFVRNGENSGTVRVTFVSNMDGEKYTVERKAGSSRYRVIRERDNHELLDTRSDPNKEDVVIWLRDHLGVPESTDLEKLWKSSIGVPQTQFTDDFAKTPGNREDVFNPLLEVDVYDEAWEDLLEVKKVIKQEKQDLKEDIENLKGKVENLDEKREEKQDLEDDIEEKQDELEELQEEKEELEEREEELEELEDEITDLEGDIEKKENTVENKEEALEEA